MYSRHSLLFLLLIVFLQSSHATTVRRQRIAVHEPVQEGSFSSRALRQAARRNQQDVPAMMVQVPFPKTSVVDTVTSWISSERRAGCNVDKNCGSSSCCTSTLANMDGTCYDKSQTRCCVQDATVLPASIGFNFTGDCCSYDANTNVYAKCPPPSDPTFNKCGQPGRCTTSCGSDSQCSPGDSCCFSPSSQTNPTDGRCFTNQEICCFDGRICNSSICENVPTDGTGQCCGVNLETKKYTFCSGNKFCNVLNGVSLCTSYLYGSAGGDNSTATAIEDGVTGGGSGSSKASLGLILGIAIPVSLVAIAVIVIIIFLVHKRRAVRPVERIVEPTVPPAYKQSAVPMGGLASGVPMAEGYNRLAVGSATGMPPAYFNQGTYAAMEAAPASIENGTVGFNRDIEWGEIEGAESIGQGSYGQVYRARWHAAPVAVKKIHPGLLNNIEAVNGFYRETELLKNLIAHPNTVLFFGVTKEPIALVMEYCQNGSLYQYIHSPAEITYSTQKNFLLGIARGMLHLHFYNIIHRDLAARNILLTNNFDVKVSDFGLSRVGQDVENHINTPVGPVNWFPPEALREHIFSSKTDVWSFGVIIWELVTRQDPFFDKTPGEVINGVAREGLTLEIPQDCPADLASLMRQCFQQNPADRPSFKAIVSTMETTPETVTA